MYDIMYSYNCAEGMECIVKYDRRGDVCKQTVVRITNEITNTE